MKVEMGRRIERDISWRRYTATGKIVAVVRRPYGRNWITRIYTPTPASLARVRRLAGTRHNIEWYDEENITVIESVIRY